MKRTYFLLFTVVSLSLLLYSCTKPKSPVTANDLTTKLTGQFATNYVWTFGGQNIGGQGLTAITKVNDTTVSIAFNSQSPVLIADTFNMNVVSSGSGYYLSVDSNFYAGAAAHYNSAYDGIYISATKQLTIYYEFYGNGENYYSLVSTL